MLQAGHAIRDHSVRKTRNTTIISGIALDNLPAINSISALLLLSKALDRRRYLLAGALRARHMKHKRP